MDDVVYVIHELSRQSNGTHSLTHSILIDLFIKTGLNIFLLPPLLSIIFVSRTSVHMFDWFYGGTRKA